MKNTTENTDSNKFTVEYLDETNVLPACTLFYQAFLSKFKSVSNMPKEQLLAIISMFWQRGLSEPYDSHFQVKKDGKLVAVYGLTYGVKQTPMQISNPVSYISILRKAGLFPFLKIQRIFQLFVHIPKPDTVYLSYLCVDKSLRGTGIGNWILDYIMEQSKANPSINHLSLYVSEQNTQARNLYLRRGFKDVKYETSKTTKHYMDIYGWYYMSLSLIY